MASLCGIALAGLCIASPYDKAATLEAFVVPTAKADPAAVRRLGVEIDVFRGDDLRPRDPAGLAKACVGGVCVLYLKICRPDGLACEFDWGRAPADGQDFYNLAFFVRARSVEAMARAQASLSLQPGEDALALTIQVSEMTERSQLPYLPPCEGNEAPSTCVNPFYGRIPWAPLRRR